MSSILADKLPKKRNGTIPMSCGNFFETFQNAGDATPIARSMRYRPDDRKGKPLNHYVRCALQENNNKDEIVCCCFFGPLLTFSGLIST